MGGMRVEGGTARGLRQSRPRAPSRWSAALRQGIDLLLPPAALDEDAGRPLSPGLSAAAWSRIQFIDAPCCDGCGAPFAYALPSRCAACLARPRAFDRARAACVYDDGSRELVLKLKHADRTDLAPLFARWLSRAASELLDEADLVAPVPMHRTRLFQRRYNQAAEIARPLCALAGVAYAPDLLRRKRDTGGQGGRSRRGRREAVRGAFHVRAMDAPKLAGRRVLLVDDVLTTGATAEACAKALKAAGARAVDVAVVARVREAAEVSI